MANKPEVDIKKLEAKIKELTKRSESLEASVDEARKAAEATKSAAASSSKELGSIKQRK